MPTAKDIQAEHHLVWEDMQCDAEQTNTMKSTYNMLTAHFS